jgi:hypothetical protein
MMETQEIGMFEIVVALGVMALWAGGTTWANKLKGKYLDPYSLLKATYEEKRQWAIKLTLIQFGFLGILGILAVATIYSMEINLSIQVMRWAFCFSGLIIAFIALAAWEYNKIGNRLSIYIQWNKEKKKDKLTKMWLFSDTGFLSSEIKERFWEFGYLENDLVKNDGSESPK